jgi:hypothetical protein
MADGGEPLLGGRRRSLAGQLLDVEPGDKTPQFCPACGSEMMPSKPALTEAKNPPAFSCFRCGVTALGYHAPKLVLR